MKGVKEPGKEKVGMSEAAMKGVMEACIGKEGKGGGGTVMGRRAT